MNGGPAGSDLADLRAALGTGGIDPPLVAFSGVAPQRTTFTSRVNRVRGRTGSGQELELFVKTSRPDVDAEITGAFSREIDFYRRIAPTLAVPLLTYRGGGCRPGDGFAFVVLDDVDASHAGLEWPLPPRPGEAARAVRWLARLHAARWADDGLTDLAGRSAPPADRVAETTRAMVGFLGSRLPRLDRRRLTRALATIDVWWPRFADAPPLVLLFGDAHFSNFLYARTPGAEPVLPCDWQHWGVGRPGYDLATMMAMHWSRQRRQRLEMPLLRTYLRALRRHGITRYGWRELLDDYRAHVYRHVVVVPAWQWSVGVPATVWWSQLERGLAAWSDLEVDAAVRTPALTEGGRRRQQWTVIRSSRRSVRGTVARRP